MVTERALSVGVQQDWKTVGNYSTVGLEFALSVIVGLLIGQWLDEKFDTGGWLTALWFFFGLVAGIRAVYRALVRANREAEQENQKNQQTKKKYFDDRQS